MAFNTLSEALDNLYTTTWQNMKDTTKDQVYDATPFYFHMRDKGKIDFVQGGRFITEPLRYAKNDTVTWIGKGEAVSLNDGEFLTIAKFDWRYLVATVVRFGVDDQQNRGKNQIISLMNAKLDNARDSLIDTLETRLAAGAGSKSTGLDGLQLMVADDPTTGTMGGIDSSTYTWWRNQANNLTGKSFATNGISAMRTMLNNCRNNLNSDSPDLILTGQTPYEYYEDTTETRHRIIGSQKMLDAGFENLAYKGIPLVWSPSIGTRMYFLNTNFLRLVVDPAMDFDMTNWKEIPDQPNDRAAQIVTAIQLTCSRRRCQGVIYNIDTA